MSKKIAIAALMGAFCQLSLARSATAAAQPEADEAYFLGADRDTGAAVRDYRPAFVLTYMTAPEMQQKVRALTGFAHTGFVTYADALGRWDPRSGSRTADRPSLVSVLFLKKISEDVAEKVLIREAFLDPEERHVFRNVDLSASPSDDDLLQTITSLSARWTAQNLSPDLAHEAVLAFRAVERDSGFLSAYEWLVATLLQHGSIYYY